MWVMLPDGAVSITMSRHEPGKLQVRARRKEWLDSFRRYCPELGPDIHLTKADYQWRALADPEHVAEAMHTITLLIDYPDFKGAAGDPERGLKDPGLRGDLVSAYHKVWSIMLKAGDGTSAYNKPGGLAEPDHGTIDICARLGHWWLGTAKDGHCSDCGTPRPKNGKGRLQYSRPTPEEVKAWWAAHPEVTRYEPPAPLLGCLGGGKPPAEGTVSECSVCHTLQVGAADLTGNIRWHKVPEAVSQEA